MKKYCDYYFTTRFEGVSERNNSTPIRHYSWAIRNKEGEILQTSEELIEGKQAAEQDCKEHIQDYYQ